MTYIERVASISFFFFHEVGQEKEVALFPVYFLFECGTINGLAGLALPLQRQILKPKKAVTKKFTSFLSSQVSLYLDLSLFSPPKLLMYTLGSIDLDSSWTNTVIFCSTFQRAAVLTCRFYSFSVQSRNIFWGADWHNLDSLSQTGRHATTVPQSYTRSLCWKSRSVSTLLL